MKSKYFYKIISSVLLLGIAGAFTHCIQNAPNGAIKTNSSSGRNPSSNTPKTEEQVINQAQVEVGIRNFEQINYTFSELTGVPVTNNTINSTYTAVEQTLPTDNRVKVVQPANQVAIVRLASEYCQLLITNTSFTANRDTLFVASFFSTAYNSLTQEQIELFINRTTNAFWGEGLINPTELTTARLNLYDLFEDIGRLETVAANKTSTNITTGTTSKAARAVCTAALSSAYVTLF